MVLPCLVAAFNSIGGSCFGWIGERISAEAANLISYDDNIESMRKEVQDLSDAIKSLEDRIEAENSRGATLVDPVVKRLMERMASLIKEASEIITEDEGSSDCTCIIRLRTNLWACYLTNKAAKKVINQAVELLEREKNLDRPVCNVNYSNILGVTPNPNFEELESRVLTSNQIVEALKDPKVHMIGIYGMGGTGKTTLAEKIGADLHLNGTFSYVILVTVSEKQTQVQSNYELYLNSIQKQIAEGLKIQLQSGNLSHRAAQLHEKLLKRDKLLIILDDIWSKFEFEKVGIPVDMSLTLKFKILMTSRSRIVLENEMDSTNNFELNSLSTYDARHLFDKMVGGDAHYSKWLHISHEVVDLCGGIPILLVTTGRALRNVNQKIWENALTQLKQFDEKNSNKEAYKKIEVSYNFLNDEEIKKLFLLCAQLDHRAISLEDLVKYAMGLDLFKGYETVKEVSGRLHKCLHDLKGCCLLQDGNKEGMIKMHDVIHKFASSMASRSHGVLCVANADQLREWPSKEQFEKLRAISFFYCPLPHGFPTAFDNPNLESFLMVRRKIDASFQIPDNFFAGMKGLKLMDLTKMSLSSILVSSLGALVTLRTLCLDGCQLSDITVIGDLPMLQVLSLVGSSIVLVPEEIGKLGRTLKLLDLRGCSKLETIASTVISRLTLLEDLRIGNSCQYWKRLLEGSHKRSNIVDETNEVEMASMEEFKNLQNLINLEIRIHNHAEMFPKDLVFTKLETFKIFLGRHRQSNGAYIFYGSFRHSRSDCISTRTLEVDELSRSVEFDSEGSKALMTNVESLRLEYVKSSVSVSEMDPKGFPYLKYLTCFEGRVIEDIVKKNGDYNHCIFPKLEMLNLASLDFLKKICDDHPLPVGSFQNLRVLNVKRCGSLNDLLSSNLARCLLQLKEIRVVDCKSMNSIIVSSESEEITHDLRVLKLYKLPCLVSFYTFSQKLPSPTPLFNKKIMFPKLEVLLLNDIKMEKIWDDHLTMTAEGNCWFQNLTSLKVFSCVNLSYLFTFSMVKSLTELQELKVEGCDSIEEIVATREGETEGESVSLFPKLEKIWLKNLPKLKRFCHANLLECQSLQTLCIVGCPLLKTFNGDNESSLFVRECSKLKTVVSANDDSSSDNNSTTLLTEKIAFPNMEELKIVKCDSLEKVFGIQVLSMNECRRRILPRAVDVSEDEFIVFEKLKSLDLQDLNGLTSFCSTSDCNFRFPSLDRVTVKNCPEMKFFCKGALSTPNLRMVEGNERRWEGDLNFTIRQLFEENAGTSNMDENED